MSQLETPTASPPHANQRSAAWTIAAAVVVAIGIAGIILSINSGGGRDRARSAHGARGALMGGIAGRESSDPNPPVVAPEMVDDLQGTLRNAALAMESWAVDHGGQYLGATFEDLYEEGLRVDPEITLELISTPSDYCILATHSMLPAANDWRVATYDSSLGEIASVNSCL